MRLTAIFVVMPQIQRTEVLAKAAIALAVVISSSSCQAWKVDNRPIEALVESGKSPVAVTMNDQRWVALRNPSIRDDSLVGTRIAGNTYGTRRMSLAVSGVRTVQTRRFSLIRTLGLGVAAAFIPSLYKLAIVEED
jgi:hypothetical protein